LAWADSSSEEALRARVEQCYSALQQGDWKKAEKYLTKESRPIFRTQTSKPLAGYQIESVKIEPDGRTASVVVKIPIISSYMPMPVPILKTTLWRLINHTWYMEIPKPAPPSNQQALFGMAPTNVPRSPPGSVFSQDLKFDSTWCGLGVVTGNETQVARFSFKNVSTHVVTLTLVQLGGGCLRLKTQQLEYKPGETGTLEIEFDPSKLELSGEQSLTLDSLFKTEPGGAYVKLTIGARVSPGPAPPAKP
jgi:hypothetical protein